MNKEQVNKLKNGLYRVYWKDGGSSLAAVGIQHNGERWIAPTNWISVPMFLAARKAWRQVDHVVGVGQISGS